MQLKKIKIAGFKSFVDPTVVLLPSKLVAVVGPNGCGKSNIIDAVSWVMGESSAKYLRGESLTDVIFSGSSARKPVGQASVELIFDNQDGTLGGEFSSYAEISIRRVITREADSAYYLNGTRCRRRDIIDIFLGTGLGPRSYSIIGQNMISRIIEAKPDDMRTYLEEAAGVSKYKERRRETENRIQHTKENLDRLNDVRIELDKQLAALKRQANAAEKFKILKQEERAVRGQWLVTQWRQLDGRLVQSTLQIQQQETGLEARQTEIGEVNLLLDTKRELQRGCGETLQDIQRNYYSVGNEITRIEQEIRHSKERKQQWQMDKNQVDKDWSEAKETLENLELDLNKLEEEKAQLEPELQKAAQSVQIASEVVTIAEEAMQDWQSRSDNFNQRSAAATQTAQVEQTRIQHFEQQLSSFKHRQVTLAEEQTQIDVSQLDAEILNLTEEVFSVNQLRVEQDNQLTVIGDEINKLQQTQKQSDQELNQLRNQLQRLNGQQSSLEALQQTALGRSDKKILQWLTEHSLDKNSRLAQNIEVSAGWEKAVEKVLDHYLQAVCVDKLEDFAQAIEQFTAGDLSLFSTSAMQSTPKSDSLLSKVKSPWSLEGLLSGVYVAQTQDEALALCDKLALHESVIIPSGEWFSPSWWRISRNENPAAGVFQREQEIKQLSHQSDSLILEIKKVESAIAAYYEQIKSFEMQRSELQKVANQTQSYLAEIQARQKMQQQRSNDLKARSERVTQEQNEIIKQLEKTQNDLATARSAWKNAMTDLEQQADLKEQLFCERDILRSNVQDARDQLNQSKDQVHRQELRIQTIKSQNVSLHQTIQRIQAQLTNLDNRKATFEKDASNITSIEDLEKALDAVLGQRLIVEEQLHSSRAELEEVDQELRQHEDRRHEIEREIVKYRDILETLRVDSKGLKVRAETLTEQITELGLVLEDIIKDLPENANADECQSQLEQLTQRISRLGPINLVAIEEYTSCLERKEYLDKQYDDLQEGLLTLENAIAKIDKETRAKFKETFDKVNERFQELFPKIFGGGRAYLELTGENLLDAGITLMACPPGKRNSTIHLLSGGEKAMTAIALVFSIFHLNPAPFCLLDEVDAPLDDANIGRFCQLVKAMSEKTQFIFVSHNKLAIEMAQHLMGVTMHEPGVSRLVSVNIEEAVSLAGA